MTFLLQRQTLNFPGLRNQTHICAPRNRSSPSSAASAVFAYVPLTWFVEPPVRSTQGPSVFSFESLRCSLPFVGPLQSYCLSRRHIVNTKHPLANCRLVSHGVHPTSSSSVAEALHELHDRGFGTHHRTGLHEGGDSHSNPARKRAG